MISCRSRSHLFLVNIFCFSFFTEAYDLFVIGIAVQMIGFVYYPNGESLLPGSLSQNNGGREYTKNSGREQDIHIYIYMYNMHVHTHKHVHIRTVHVHYNV